MQDILHSNPTFLSKPQEKIPAIYNQASAVSFPQHSPKADFIKALLERCSKLSEDNERLIHEGLELADQLELLQAEKSQLDARLANIKYEQQRNRKLNNESSPSISDEISRFIIRIFAGETLYPTPVECLKMIEAVSAKHLEILPSAWKSAEEISCCKKGDRLLRLLAKLAGPYYELLLKGGGDSQARMVFSSKEYAASESATISSDPVHRARRTFTYKGQEIYMERHLRIGVENDLSLTVRVYFAWIPDEKKIVIGYCGKHLPVTKFSH